jgi:hypothetical protein
MPQGLQVWDGSGNLMLDTTTYVLKSFAVTVVSANAATGQFDVAPMVPSASVVKAYSDIDSSLPNTGTSPIVTYDSGNKKINYQFTKTGNYNVVIRGLAY